MIYGHYNQKEIDALSSFLGKHSIPYQIQVADKAPHQRGAQAASLYLVDINDEDLKNIPPELYRPLEEFNIFADPALDQSHFFENLDEPAHPIEDIPNARTKKQDPLVLKLLSLAGLGAMIYFIYLRYLEL